MRRQRPGVHALQDGSSRRPVLSAIMEDRSRRVDAARSVVSSSWCYGAGSGVGVRRVERLHAGLVVAVERRHRAVGAEAEVVVGRVGEPHADLVEVDADALAVDERARRTPPATIRWNVLSARPSRVGGDVADVLGRAERRPPARAGRR